MNVPRPIVAAAIVAAALVMPGRAYAQIDFSGVWAPIFHEDQPERVPGPDIGNPEPSSHPAARCVVSITSDEPSQRPTEKPSDESGVSAGAVRPSIQTRRGVLCST